MRVAMSDTPFPALESAARSPTWHSRKSRTAFDMLGILNIFSRSISNQTISANSINGAEGSQSGASGSSSNTGAIVGGVIGGLAIVGIAVAIVFVILRKRRRQQQQYEEERKPEIFVQTPHHPSLSPYYPPTALAPSVNESFRAGNGSDYVPLSPHSDTTAGFAGIGTSNAGALHVANPAYASSTNTMTYTSDAYESTAMAPSLSVAASSKAREVALNRTHHYAPSVAPSSNVGSQTGSVSSRDLLSPGSSASHSISPTDVLGLRAEVENLRRVMQEIRADRFEPPPEYVEE